MNNRLIHSKVYPVEGEYAYIKTVFKIEPDLYQFRILSKNLNLEKMIDIDLRKTPNILICIQRVSENKPEFEVSLKAGRFYFI